MNEYDFSEGGFCEACMKIWIIVLTKKKRNEKKRLTNPETYDKLSKSSGNGHEKNMGVFPSGQWGQTVNLLLFSFGGSNPPAPMKKTAGVEIHWRFSFAQMSDSHRRVDENSCGPALCVPPGKNSLLGCF